MSSIDVSRPIETIQDQMDVLVYAEHLQSKLETVNPYEVSDSDLLEVAGHLDGASSGIYYGSQVALSGLYQIYRPFSKNNLTPVPSLENGIVDGVSSGFAVRALSRFKPDVLSDNFEHEMTLYEELYARTKGEFVVCHMVHHDTKPAMEDHQGLISNHAYQALGPVRESSLHIWGQYEEAVQDSMLDNSHQLLNDLSVDQQNAIDKIKEELASNADPLKAMVRAAASIDIFVNDGSEPLNRALFGLLSDGRNGPLIKRAYQFKAMPPILYGEGEMKTFGNIAPSDLRVVFVRGLSVADQYLIDNNGKHFWPNPARKGLYIQMATIIHSDHIEYFHIPLNLINEASFWRINS